MRICPPPSSPSPAPQCRSVNALDASLAAWNALTGSGAAGPLMADRTITTGRFNEYHVWPVSATASWTLLNSGSQKTFVLS
jgi:hypothetical protein